MKKFFNLLLLTIFMCLLSCNRNMNTANVNPKSETTKCNKQSSNEEKVIDFELFKNVTPEIYKHVQKITLDFDKKIYKEPLNSEILCTLTDGDIIETSEIIEYSKDLIYLRISTNSINIGYILIQENPYENGKFTDLGIIDSDDTTFKLIQMNVKQYFVEDANVMSEPSEKSTIVYVLKWSDVEQPVPVSMVTDPGKWWKVNINGKEGWINFRFIDYKKNYYNVTSPEIEIESQVLRYPH